MNKSTNSNYKNNPLWRAVLGLGAVGFLSGGLAACDNKTETADNSTRMEESISESRESTADAWITTKVKADLLADDLSKGYDIKVTTLDGVVSLDGKVENAESLAHIQQIAEAIKGVQRVDSTGLMLETTQRN